MRIGAAPWSTNWRSSAGVRAGGVPREEARQTDVRRPVRRHVHDARRRANEIRAARLDREKERVANGGEPVGEARRVITAGSNERRMFQRAVRQPTRRMARPTGPSGSRARLRLGSVCSLGIRPGKTLNVAQRVPVSSAAIGLASTVGCETSRSAPASELRSPRPRRSDSGIPPCGTGAKSPRSPPAARRESPDQRRTPQARTAAPPVRTADPRPRPATHTRPSSRSAQRARASPSPWPAQSQGHPNCPSSRTRPEPHENSTIRGGCSTISPNPTTDRCGCPEHAVAARLARSNRSGRMS